MTGSTEHFPADVEGAVAQDLRDATKAIARIITRWFDSRPPDQQAALTEIANKQGVSLGMTIALRPGEAPHAAIIAVNPDGSVQALSVFGYTGGTQADQ